MITTERMAEIMIGITVGSSPPIKGKDEEERDFIKTVSKEIKEIKAAGHEVSIPGEWQ
tara:strand:+ start:50088 stop:50261 length:174 start_codon:yes stop_codon:yes gene_type:complete